MRLSATRARVTGHGQSQTLIQRAIALLRSPRCVAWREAAELNMDKATWRRNLCSESEFRNGVTDAPVRSGLISATTLAGYGGALAIGYDGATATYAYKSVTTSTGAAYAISVIVEMTDGLSPAFGSASLTSSLNDFVLIGSNSALNPLTYVVESLGGSTYRVRASVTSTGSTNWGISKYAGNSSRTFKVTGYQVELGSATAYQKITDFYTEFLAAFPTHGMFQDSAGTIPVTGVEQPVGLILDKRTAGQLGPELVTNGDFGNGTTGWSAANGGTISVSSGELTITNSIATSGRASQFISTEIGKTYRITAKVRVGTGTSVILGWGTALGSFAGGSTSSTSPIDVPLSLVFVATATATSIAVGNPSAVVGHTSIADNISVRELPGTHWIQATPASRPKFNSRYNLCLYTETFLVSGATLWQESAAGQGNLLNQPGPSGKDNAILITRTAGSSAYKAYGYLTGGFVVGARYVISFTVGKYQSLNNCVMYVGLGNATGTLRKLTLNLDTGALTNESPSEVLNLTATQEGAFWRVRYEVVAGIAAHQAIYVSTPVGAAVGDGLYIAEPSILKATNSNLPYQRVNAATDYDWDFSKFPPKITYDGVDDGMSTTAAVNLTGTDKITVVAAVHKASDAATGMFLEHGPNSSTTSGTFGLALPPNAGANYDIYLRGDTGVSGSRISVAAPATLVTAVTLDISGSTRIDEIKPRVNGTAAPTTAAFNGPAGGGNLSAQTQYIGSRGGTTLRFNGDEFLTSEFIDNLTLSELSALEAYSKYLAKAPY